LSIETLTVIANPVPLPGRLRTDVRPYKSFLATALPFFKNGLTTKKFYDNIELIGENK
jgi:hypothetical protein